MDYNECFDKLHIPVLVCDQNGIITVKNKACRKYLPLPRSGSDIGKYIVEDYGYEVQSLSDVKITAIRVEKDGYIIERTAAVFQYHGSSVYMFFSVLNYDVFRDCLEKSFVEGASEKMTELLDILLMSNNDQKDKYGLTEKIRTRIYDVVDNYSVISYIYGGPKCICKLSRFFRFVENEFYEIIRKSGHRISFKVFDEVGAAEELYVDVRRYALLFVNLLLFILSVSDKRTCEIEVSVFANRVNNSFNFSSSYLQKTANGQIIDELIANNPFEYINYLPFEVLCDDLNGTVICSKNAGKRFDTSLELSIELSDEKGFSSMSDLVHRMGAEDFLSVLLSTVFIA